MFRYYIWRARHFLTVLVCLAVLGLIILFASQMTRNTNQEHLSAEISSPPPLFIVERTYTKENGYSCVFSDGKYLYDNDLQRLPRLSPSELDRIEIDIELGVTDHFETYEGSLTIDPLSVEKADFQFDIPYNFYGTQQDIALYIALMIGSGFEVESLYETRDSAFLELSMEKETVRIVVGRNRLRIYSKMISMDEFKR